MAEQFKRLRCYLKRYTESSGIDIVVLDADGDLLELGLIRISLSLKTLPAVVCQNLAANFKCQPYDRPNEAS